MNPLKAEASRLLTANLDARQAIAEAVDKCWGDHSRQHEIGLLTNAADALNTHRELVLLLDRQADNCIRALRRAGLAEGGKALKP